jgi:hypothetical protein
MGKNKFDLIMTGGRPKVPVSKDLLRAGSFVKPHGVARQEEIYLSFTSDITGKELVQYDYRSATGKLFSCVALTLAVARARRNVWLNNLEV